MAENTFIEKIVFLSFISFVLATTSYCQVITTEFNSQIYKNRMTENRMAYAMDEQKEQQEKKKKNNTKILIVTIAVVTVLAGFFLFFYSDP